jgi:hypothetical protein
MRGDSAVARAARALRLASRAGDAASLAAETAEEGEVLSSSLSESLSYPSAASESDAVISSNMLGGASQTVSKIRVKYNGT